MSYEDVDLFWGGVETGVIRGCGFLLGWSGDSCHKRKWIYCGVRVDKGVIRGSGFIVG